MENIEMPVEQMQARIKFNLQRFAGSSGADPTSAPPAEPAPAPPADLPADPPAEPAGINFSSQADLDAHVQQILNTAKGQWQKDAQTQKSYEQMSQSEKNAFDLQKAKDDLAASQKVNLTLQNRSAMTAKLTAEELPASLVDVFGDVLSEEQATIDASYKTVTDAFRNALKSAVEQRLAGSAGKPGASGGNPTPQESAGLAAAKARNGANQGVKNSWTTKL